VADFARQIVGDQCEVRCVLAPGQDPHLYEITPNDVTLVRDAQLLLANGLHLEGNDWILKLGQDVGKPIVICTEGIEPLQIETPHDGQVLHVPDPHAWFTPQNAAVYVRNIVRAVMEIDPTHAEHYQARAELYLAQLRSLDAWIVKHCNAIPRDRRILLPAVWLSRGGTRGLVDWSGDRGRNHLWAPAGCDRIDSKVWRQRDLCGNECESKADSRNRIRGGSEDRRRAVLGLDGLARLGRRDLSGHDARKRLDDRAGSKVTT
jgi:hypothetical protein